MAEPDTELDQLRAIARRAGIDADHPVDALEAPPADLWDRIAAETGIDEPSVPDAATVTPITRPVGRRRRQRWVLPLAAAAAAVVVVAAGVTTLGGGDDPDIVARAALERLGPAGTGTAELVDDHGQLRLRVDTSGLDAGDGFLEIWVIDTEVQRLISLGPLRPDGVYDLPPGLDPASFPIVDVSVEPIDGDPTHSGDSVLRGQLEF